MTFPPVRSSSLVEPDTDPQPGVPVMTERIHACLDGDLSRDDLLPSEREQLAELEGTLRAAVGHLRAVPVPDFTARVMAALPPAEAPAPAGESPAPWRAALSWLWAPFQVTLRPAYALAAVLLLGVALPRLPGPGGTPSLAPVAVAPTRPAQVYVQFRVEVEDASQVAIAGTFTGWKPGLQLQETEPGVWSALVPLQPGVHDYVFVVDGERWVPDPHAPQVADSFGGTNSRISLPPPASA